LAGTDLRSELTIKFGLSEADDDVAASFSTTTG
jgi:hypothetical protein